jgi:hypothetical protein
MPFPPVFSQSRCTLSTALPCLFHRLPRVIPHLSGLSFNTLISSTCYRILVFNDESLLSGDSKSPDCNPSLMPGNSNYIRNSGQCKLSYNVSISGGRIRNIDRQM